MFCRRVTQFYPPRVTPIDQTHKETHNPNRKGLLININDAFPSKYLKAGDLPEEGTLPVTIEKISPEEIGKSKEKKFVIYFEETDRGLVLNKTNARSIAKLAGSEDFDDWTGKKINLYRAEVEFQGDMVEAIRVSLRSKTAIPKQEPEEGGEIPF